LARLVVIEGEDDLLEALNELQVLLEPLSRRGRAVRQRDHRPIPKCLRARQGVKLPLGDRQAALEPVGLRATPVVEQGPAEEALDLISAFTVQPDELLVGEP
jgi:hypothetical protein